MRHTLFGISLTLAAVALAAPARAQEAAPNEAVVETNQPTKKPVNVGAGLLFVFGGNFIDKPSDKTLQIPGDGRAETKSYPGFGGLTLGGGLMFDLRIIDLFGLEIDVLRTKDKGSGKITFNGITDVKIKLSQSAWHVPVLAKLVIPTPLVRPMFFIGPEFVFPSGEKAEVEGPLAVPVDSKADSYTMVTFGGGVEIKLPTPGVDIRIPISIRGSINPGVSDHLEDRVDAQIDAGGNISAITYHSEYKYQAVMTVGGAIYF